MAELRTIPSVTAQLAARRAVLGPQADLLTSFGQGIQQGQALSNLPETLQQQQQALALQQLQTQLATAATQQKLRDLQDPQGALIRQLQQQLVLKSVEPTSGIIASPVGLEGEAIGLPGALTAEQQAALVSGGAQPSVSPLESIQPIVIGGQPSGFAQDIERAISGTEALSRARGATALENQLLRNAQSEANRLSREKIASEANISKENVADKKSKGGAGLTPNQQTNLLIKYGLVKESVGDLSNFQDEQGNTDYSKLAVEIGKAERSQKISDLNAKQSSLSPALKKEASGYISSLKDLENLKTTLLDLDSKGADPGTFQNAFAVMANNPSEGFFSSLTRQFANSQLTEDTKKKEAMRSALESAVTKSLSGAAVTKGEAQRLTGLIPKADDTLKILINKTGELEAFLNNKISGLTEAGSLGTAPSAESTQKPSTPSTIPAPQELTPAAQKYLQKISP